MTNYAMYLKEREGIDTIENEKGFLTYKVKDDEMWVYDCYVRPEFRRDNVAREYFDTLYVLANDLNCSSVYSTVYKSTEGWEVSLAALRSNGYEITGTIEDLIILKRIL